MRIGEYKRVGTDYADKQRWIPPVSMIGENGNIIETEGYYETVQVEIPIMDMVYRDATPEEEAAFAEEQARLAYEEASREPTEEERLRADVDFLLAMGGMIV